MNEDNDQDLLSKFLSDESLSEDEMTQRQWQIIDAAVKIFSEKGFEGSRTSDIAKEAEVAEGTIFRYYKTKKDLLIALLLPMITKFFRPLILLSVEKIMDNKEDKSIEEILSTILLDRLQLAKKNSPLVKTILIESTYHPELLEPIRKEIAPRIIPIIDRYVEDNIKSGKLKDLDPRVITRTMMSSLIGYIILTSYLPELFPSEGDDIEMKKVADFLLHGLAGKE